MKTLIYIAITLIATQVIAVGLKYFKISIFENISWGWILSPSIVAAIVIAFIAFIIHGWKA